MGKNTNNSLFMKSLVFGIIVLFLGASIVPCISGNIGKIKGFKEVDGCLADQVHGSIPGEGVLDSQFIYNITENLSNIIFTEYNESKGEIAKGRAFGTKGEWKAAEIIQENMSKLGLYCWNESICNLQEYPAVASKMEVLAYKLVITNKTSNHSETVDCYITPIKNGPRGKPEQVDYNFTFKDLKVKYKPIITFPRSHEPSGETEDYVFIAEEQVRNPNFLPFVNRIIERFPATLRFTFLYRYLCLLIKKLGGEKDIWYKNFSHCQGIIVYDFNDDTHNMGYYANNALPTIYINGTVGRKIVNDAKNFTIDYYLNQSYNESVISYNVIGQLNGTYPNKTVIVSCLYDCWWNQGTADSAIGMAIVLGIAKYFQDHNITPKYTLKFIAFGGEEFSIMRGATYYNATHKNENITYVIDLNQLGFTQEEPKLTLYIIANKLPFMMKIWKIVKRTDYTKRTGDNMDIGPVWLPPGGPSDCSKFAMRPDCKTILFVKGPPWLLHHRDGLNHTEGDVMKYFDRCDVNISGEIILNVTKYLVTNDFENIFTSYNRIYKDLNHHNLSIFQKEKQII